MKLNNVRKIAFSAALILIVTLILIFSSSIQFSELKDNGRIQGQLTKKLTQVTGVWLSVKIAGGIISVLQTIQVEGSIPVIGGLAVSAHPLGWTEVVDNTLDHISNICLWAMGALALQKVLLAISLWVSLRIVIPICAFLIIITIWYKKFAKQLKRIIAGIVIISLGLCFAIPLSLALSHAVESGILSNYLDETVNGIDSTTKEIEEKGESTSEVGLLRRMGSGIANFFNNLKHFFDTLIEKVVNFIICFIVTSIIIPIGTLFFLKYLVNAALKYIGFSEKLRITGH